VEVVDDRPGVDWLTGRLRELHARWGGGLIGDGLVSAPTVGELERAGLEPVAVGAAELAKACLGFVDAAASGRLAHRPQPALDTAVTGAARRPIGDGWAWSRRAAGPQITPLVAATLALAGHDRRRTTRPVVVAGGR
jgi:hypothetical protein